MKVGVRVRVLLQLSPFFASIFPLFPQKRLILRLKHMQRDGSMVGTLDTFMSKNG